MPESFRFKILSLSFYFGDEYFFVVGVDGYDDPIIHPWIIHPRVNFLSSSNIGDYLITRKAFLNYFLQSHKITL